MQEKLVDILVEKCTENVEEVQIVGMDLFERGNECTFSCTIYVVLIVFAICIGIGTYFIYDNYMNHDKKNCF